MPRGTPAIHQWPYMAPMKRESAERKGADNGSGTLMTLVGNLMPSASVKDQWALFSEVERQFSLPRLPVPQLDDSLRALRNCVHPGIEALPEAVLTSATVSVRADMAWRWLRYERLHNPRLPRYEVDADFIAWLQSVSGSQVQRWGQLHLPRLPGLPHAETQLRLARLRPLPLDILFAWHEATTVTARAFYAPGPDLARLDYVVSACMQKLDAYYLRDRQRVRRLQGVNEIDESKSAQDALHGPASGQLTLPDAVLGAAERLSASAVEAQRSRKPLAPSAASDSRPKQSSRGRTEGAVQARCTTCQANKSALALARSPKNMRYPPFVVVCTCHFAFDWEGEPLVEAAYEHELEEWAKFWVAEVPYPFPTRLVLLKLAEAAR